MVKRVVGAAAALLVLVALGALIWLNPGVVDFQFAREQTLRLPLGWLLVFAFSAGAVAALLVVSLQQLARRLVGWRQRRRHRAAELVAGWERSALALAWDGDVDRARVLLHKALRRGPDNHGAALALAASYMETGETQRARQVLEDAVTHDARDADVRVALGEALRQSGDLSEAIRIVETVRVQHPRAPRALLALREMYREAGRWEDAVQVQSAYVGALPPASRDGHEGEQLANLQYRAAMTHESLPARSEALTAVLDRHRHHVPALVGLGDALVASGRTDEAVRLWDRALRGSPCLLVATRLFARQTSPRDRQRFLASLAKIPGISSDTIQYFTARAAIDEGNYDAAAAALDQLADREQPAIQRLWADIHRQRGAIREALKALVSVADADPHRAGGFPCSVCQRVPEPPGAAMPACRYWDGVRSLEEGRVSREA
jgi:tetratricopeptide (TPR) repeat protein